MVSGELTNHETSLIQVILEIANPSSTTHGDGTSLSVNFIGLELPKVDGQSLMEILPRGSKAMPLARGEEGNVVLPRKLNL